MKIDIRLFFIAIWLFVTVFSCIQVATVDYMTENNSWLYLIPISIFLVGLITIIYEYLRIKKK